MTSFADLTKQIEKINELILSDLTNSGKVDPSEDALRFNKRLQATKHWFSRISWTNKKRFVLVLLDDMRSAWALSLILKSLWNCRLKDAINSVSGPKVWCSYDQVPIDHNRTAKPDSTLVQVMKFDRAWFHTLQPQNQTLVILDLLTLCGGPIMWEVLGRSQMLYEGYRQELLRNLVECDEVLSQLAERRHPQSPVEKAKKDPLSNRQKSSVDTAAPGQAQKELENHLLAWNAAVKSLRDSLKIEEVEIKFEDGSNKKIWRVHRPRPESIETVDFLQLLPSEMGKIILSYLPRAQLGDYARVNKYWSYLIDDFRAEVAARQKMKIEYEKWKSVLSLHDPTMTVQDQSENPPNSAVGVIASSTKQVQPSQFHVTSVEKPIYVSPFKHERNKIWQKPFRVQKPMRNFTEFSEQLNLRGACDDGLPKWCNNAFKIIPGGKQKQNSQDGMLPLGEIHFPCPLLKQIMEVPLQQPLIIDPTAVLSVKPNRNVSIARISIATDVHEEQGDRRYNLWTKDFSSLFPVLKIPSYQWPT